MKFYSTFVVLLVLLSSIVSGHNIKLIGDAVAQASEVTEQQVNYAIVDTNQTDFYSDEAEISVLSEGEAFYGQDATYEGNQASYTDNGNGTISDNVTGLMWQQDMGDKITFDEALEKAQESTLGGYSDWRLPNAKELHSIVDYTSSLQTTNSAAIDPIFDTSSINDPEGEINYPFFWSGTTHLDGAVAEDGGVYIAFGEAQGEMNGALMDVHGAGAQRSDPKSGNADDYPQYWGPQGDVRYVYNYVRSVRTTDVTESSDTNYTNVYNFVNRFYVEVLNREGEPGGLEYWTNPYREHRFIGASR